MSQDISPLEQELGNSPGIGLTLEHIRLLISQAHDVTIPKDDAILMIATIFNAYLAEIEQLHERHEKGLTRLMAEKTEEYVSRIQDVVDQLSSSLSSTSVASICRVFEDHRDFLRTFKGNMRLATLIVGMSALLNVAVFIFKAVQ